jgi:N-glycosylase/DNA lyase
MAQTAYYQLNGEFHTLQLPEPEQLVIDLVAWGRIDEILTPASWAFQCAARMDSTDPHRFRMGDTLEEEYATCLLAGYGVPAEIGMAAACRLRDHGVLDGTGDSTEEGITRLLEAPLDVDGRHVRYRFYKTKSRQLSAGLEALREGGPDETDTGAFRAWFRGLPGVGAKTSSFITRNWLGSDDVAILDIHVVRACQAFGLFEQDVDLSKCYGELETRFVSFARAIEVKASWLDALMWEGMRRLSPRTIAQYAPVNSRLSASIIQDSGSEATQRDFFDYVR